MGHGVGRFHRSIECYRLHQVVHSSLFLSCYRQGESLSVPLHLGEHLTVSSWLTAPNIRQFSQVTIAVLYHDLKVRTTRNSEATFNLSPNCPLGQFLSYIFTNYTIFHAQRQFRCQCALALLLPYFAEEKYMCGTRRMTCFLRQTELTCDTTKKAT